MDVATSSPALKLAIDSDGLLDGLLERVSTQASGLSPVIQGWLQEATASELRHVVLNLLGSNPSSRTPSFSGEQTRGRAAFGSSAAGTTGLVDRSLARSTTNILPDMGKPAHGHGSAAYPRLARHHVAAAAGNAPFSTEDLPVALDFSRLFEQKGPFSSIGALSGQGSDEKQKELFGRLCLRKVSKQDYVGPSMSCKLCILGYSNPCLPRNVACEMQGSSAMQQGMDKSHQCH